MELKLSKNNNAIKKYLKTRNTCYLKMLNFNTLQYWITKIHAKCTMFYHYSELLFTTIGDSNVPRRDTWYKIFFFHVMNDVHIVVSLYCTTLDCIAYDTVWITKYLTIWNFIPPSEVRLLINKGFNLNCRRLQQ